MLAKIRVFLLVGLLVVSVGFGLVKQVKKATRSAYAFTSAHSDHDRRFAFLKPHAKPQNLPGRVRYVSNRIKEQFKTAPIYFYYEAQYALAPVLLEYAPRVEKLAHESGAHAPAADFYVLDFTTAEDLEKFRAANGLSVIAREGGVALARRSAP